MIEHGIRLDPQREARVGLPPARDAVGGESRSIVGGAHEDVAAVGDRVEHSVGGSDVARIAAEVVVVHRCCELRPDSPRILEAADEFLLLGVDGDHGQFPLRERAAHVLDVEGLLIALASGPSRSAGELLVVDPQPVLQTVEKTGHGSGANLDVELA